MKVSQVWFIALLHLILICVSNILVHFPFNFLGYNSTWGAISYPLIFIVTDLTVRLLGAETAAKVVRRALLPGVILSYLISSKISTGEWYALDTLLLRIALASLMAYCLGQYLDIAVFYRLRRSSKWWLAPTVSSTLGNCLDTGLFFSIAFYQCNNAFLAHHWPEIAAVDLGFKLLISCLTCIPLYGLMLNWLTKHHSQGYTTFSSM